LTVGGMKKVDHAPFTEVGPLPAKKTDGEPQRQTKVETLRGGDLKKTTENEIAVGHGGVKKPPKHPPEKGK